MANVDISVIIPSKNNKNTTAKIIRCISESTKNLEVEYIVIDMNSTDNSILSALNEIKKNNLRGCVIQSGGGSVSSALNTGIYKSDGKYITFVYPSRLYKSDYIPEYYSTIEEKNADIVFSAPKTELVSAEMGNIDGSELAIGLVRSVISMDFCAVMIRREYLLDNHIKFYEDCVTGYAEAFVFNALLFEPKIAYSDIKLERDKMEIPQKEDFSQNNGCFSRIDAMLKVYETMQLTKKGSPALKSAFEYNKLPSVVMSCVDILLKDGFPYSAIKNSLKLKEYDKLLKLSVSTPPKLRMKILKWRFIPKLYKP